MPSLRRRVQPFIMCHTHTVLSPRSLPLTPCLVLIVFYLPPPTKPFAPFDLRAIPPLDSPHRTSSLFHCPTSITSTEVRKHRQCVITLITLITHHLIRPVIMSFDRAVLNTIQCSDCGLYLQKRPWLINIQNKIKI